MTFGCNADDGETGNDDVVDDGDTGTSDSETEAGESDTGDGDAFALESAALDATGQFVTLTFSEPVAPVDGVDPTDFRISVAQLTESCTGDDCTTQTTYWDPHFFIDYYIDYQGNSMDRFEADLIMAGDQPTDVTLRFGVPLEPLLCDYFSDYLPGYDTLFVHYAPGEIPVQSSGGDSLAGIGTQWVAEEFPVFAVDGEFPNLAPKIAIPCSL